MALLIYVDNSNLWIEGKRVSAVETGMAKNINEAIQNGIFDNGYRIDFGKLYKNLSDGQPVKRMVLFGSKPPENDTIWDLAKSEGFDVITEDRNKQNKEKKIDTGIVAKITREAYKVCDVKEDKIVLVAGDSDYVPVLDELAEDDFKLGVVFWDHANKEIKYHTEVEFTGLNKDLKNIQYTK